MKLLKENIGRMPFDIGLIYIYIYIFFLFVSSSKGKKSKYKPMRQHQTKMHLYNEETYRQNEKTTYRMREDICK